MGDGNPNDVERALAAFGATPIKYRSFGRHHLRPAAAHVPAPAVIDDTVYDPFGPQPVVHSLDDSWGTVLLPANVPEGPTPDPSMPGRPASELHAVEQPDYEHPAHYASPSADDFPVATPAEHEVPAYGVPTSHPQFVPAQAGLGPEEPSPSLSGYQPHPPEPLPDAPPQVEAPAPIQPEPVHAAEEPLVDSRPDFSAPEPLRAASPVAASPVAASPVAASPVAASPVAASPVAAAPTPLVDAPAPPARPRLPTLGSRLAARENMPARVNPTAEIQHWSIADMFRILNGRSGPVRRPAAPAAGPEEVSLFRRL